MPKKRLWDQCRKVAQSLVKVDWITVPMTVLRFGLRDNVCSILVVVGATEAAIGLATCLLSGRQFEENKLYGNQWNAFLWFNSCGGTEDERNDYDQVYEQKFSEALRIPDRLAKVGATKTAEWLGESLLTASQGRMAKIETAGILRCVAGCLEWLGRHHESLGGSFKAYALYSDALNIRRRLAKKLGTADSRLEVAYVLERLGDTEKKWLGHQRRKHYTEALNIYRQLAEECGEQLCLDILRIEESLEEITLAYCRRFAERQDTQKSRQEVARSLVRLGDIAEKGGDSVVAIDNFSEALEILRELARKVDTPQNHRDVSELMDRIDAHIADWENSVAQLDEQ